MFRLSPSPDSFHFTVKPPSVASVRLVLESMKWGLCANATPAPKPTVNTSAARTRTTLLCCVMIRFMAFSFTLRSAPSLMPRDLTGSMWRERLPKTHGGHSPGSSGAPWAWQLRGVSLDLLCYNLLSLKHYTLKEHHLLSLLGS